MIVGAGGARPISLAALTVLEVTPAEMVRIAARCGYSHVGLRPVAATPGEPHVPILTDPALRRELLQALRGEGIGVLDVEIVRLRPAMDWDEITRVLDFAAEFAAPRLLVADNDPDPARSREHLARMAAEASDFGVTPHLEFMPWTEAPGLAAARERIAGIANAKLLVDSFHLARSGGTPDEIAPGDPAIGYLQLADIAGPIPAMDEILAEARGNRLFPGEGEINLAALLTRLPGLPVSLEIPADRLRDAGVSAEERARRAIAATRDLLERTG
ncbi:sugar phosphate isomerase/epimerase [Novosphingobium flavum]|uniref:Sugar phosphate isomerase/epimerase n=1 Tax=Novosphingobium flavum TaxID=1778672 RepID=A0A7X1KMP0_9SPHN|nr:sugar phosphate isomerase/epimerase [Novosphingobium flavum]MBC2666839.1 sugar phosphate isomerase/epimerase [Novosphingobium flavum]